MKTNEELERAAYIAGDTEKAALYAIANDVDQLSEDIEDIPALLEAYQDLGSAEEIREKLEQLEEYKEFFNDCFARLAGHYPCPSVTSDHDKSVIFAAIEKGEGVQDV